MLIILLHNQLLIHLFMYRLLNVKITTIPVNTLPVMPSPNLKEMQSIYLYPSTCFFEGTVLSEGRGTDEPFQIFGHPALPNNLYALHQNPMPEQKTVNVFIKPAMAGILMAAMKKY